MFSAALNPSADGQSLLDVSPPERVGKSRIVSLGESHEPSSPYSFNGTANPKVSNGMIDPNSLVARVETALRAEREAILKDMTTRHNTLISDLMDGQSFGSLPAWHSIIADGPQSPDTGRSNGAEPQHVYDPPTAEKKENQEASEATAARLRQSQSNLRKTGTDDLYLQERAKVTSTGGRICFEMRWIIFGAKFESLFAVLIFLNAITMAVEAQYNSFDTAHTLGWPITHTSAADTWPGADKVFPVLEFLFGSVFTLEVVAKLGVGPITFVKSGWNWFDTTIVAIWILSLFDVQVTKRNPMILRATRLVRIGRVVRLVKTVQVFNILHLLIQAFSASMRVLIWSLLLVAMVMLAFALVFNFIVEPHIVDKSQPEAGRIELYKRFGSFYRAFVTMLEMTIGNWVPPTRLLMEHVHEAFGVLCMLYVCTVNFAMIQVVRSVFVHETFSVANNDCDLMVMQQEKKVRHHAENMKMLFMEADESGDGYLSVDEFEGVTQDPRVKAWLAAMELDVSDARVVFDLLDDGDQKLSATELAKGVRKLKGSARSIDLLSLQNLCRKIERHVSKPDQSGTRSTQRP